MATVAVIGAGPGGLAAARAAVEHGLEPTVFERADTPGGVWRDGGTAWPGMSTNLSHPLCAFSDHHWPDDTRDFPRQAEVAAYLASYADRRDLTRRIRFGHEITDVTRAGSGWDLRWAGGHGRFTSVIVASGAFSRPRLPRVPGRFTGTALHSGDYHTADALPAGPVVVVGLSFSGGEIAAEVAGTGREVTVVASRPMWLVPRAVDGVPRDLRAFTRRVRHERAALPVALRHRRAHQRYERLGANPGRFDRRLWLDPDSTAPPFVLPTDQLRARLDTGAVTLEPGRVTAVDPGGVVLDTGTRLPCATIIWCTGYHLDLPFLDAGVRAALSLDPGDLFQPLLLDRCTFHPDVPGMAFVGLYRGPFFAVLELQARWAAAVLSGARPMPDGSGIAGEARIRRETPRPQFPHGDYIGLADGIAGELGVAPDLDPRDEWYPALWDGPVIGAHYRWRGPGADPVAAARGITAAGRLLSRR